METTTANRNREDDLAHLQIGEIVAPRGVHGEVKVKIETDDPERFYALDRVYLGDTLTPFEVERARLFKSQALLQLKGIENRNQAERLRNTPVYVAIEDALPLGKDQFYYHQIEGLPVLTIEGEELGYVAEILRTGSNDVYVIRGGQTEILLPVIRGVIREIDIEKGKIIVKVPDGLC
ncbi:MAG: ribosome maturation factor RimM [Anaerolineales bacterium]